MRFENTTDINDAVDMILLKKIHASLEDAFTKIIFHENEIKESHLCPPEVIFLLGVSGGCDSIALLHSIIDLLQPTKLQNSYIHDDVKSFDAKRNSNKTLYTGFFRYGQFSNAGHKRSNEINSLNSNDNDYNSNSDDDLSNIAIPCQLHVVHFNHKQRAIDSDQDCYFVQQLCQNYDTTKNNKNYYQNDDKQNESSLTMKIPISIYDWKNHEQAEKELELQQNQRVTGAKPMKNMAFTQDRARQWRQQEMMKLLNQLIIANEKRRKEHINQQGMFNHNNEKQNKKTIGLILTAHHQDDSNESLLLKILRGAHITKLQGIELTSNFHYYDEGSNNMGFGHDNIATGTKQQFKRIDDDQQFNKNRNGVKKDMFFVRPMLKLSKQTIQEYLVNNNYRWREDSSNKSSKYLRNRIRNELMPLLEDLVATGRNNKSDFDQVDTTNINKGDNNGATSGKDNLQKRLDQLAVQSKELRQDVNDRTKQILKQCIDDKNRFIINDMIYENGLTFIVKEAIYSWIIQKSDYMSYPRRKNTAITVAKSKEIKKKLFLSYSGYNRAWDKITDDKRHHHSRWVMNLGQGYNLVRDGDCLDICFDNCDEESKEKNRHKDNLRPISWSFLSFQHFPDDDEVDLSIKEDDGKAELKNEAARGKAQMMEEKKPYLDVTTTKVTSKIEDRKKKINYDPNSTVVIRIKKAWLDEAKITTKCDDENDINTISFFLTNASNDLCGNWKITPPWRKNEISLKEFLRGQKVPSYQRKEASIIIMKVSIDADRERRASESFGASSSAAPQAPCKTLLKGKNEHQLVAVYVKTKQKWIINSKFDKSSIKNTRQAIHSGNDNIEICLHNIQK